MSSNQRSAQPSLLRSGSILALGAMALVAPQAAFAQESDVQTEEIVVMAQKRAENVQDVPISISAVSAERLEQAGVIDAAQIGAVVPGITVGVAAQSFQPRVRGVGTPAFGPGIENPVALYIDDVYIGSQLQGLTDFTDVEQIAVLKGPQGTLFGRNTTGGVIQLTTRQPDDEFNGQFRTELDNYMTSRSNAYVSGPLGEHIRANLSLSYTTQDEGWGTSTATGDDIHRIDHDISARSNWEITPTDATTIRFSADYSEKENNNGPNLRSVVAPPYGNPSYVPPSDIYDTDNNFDNLNEYEGGGGSIYISHDFDFARLVSISAYRTFTYKTRFDASLQPTPLLDVRYNQYGEQLTQELQLVSPDNDRFNWVAGVFYLQGTDGGDPIDVNFHGPIAASFGIPGSPDVIVRTHSEQRTESTSVFAQGTLGLSENTHLTLGARYTDETRELSGFQESALSFFGAPYTPFTRIDAAFEPEFDQFGPNPAFNPATAPISAEMSESATTWRLSLDHQFSDDLMGYISYNRGFKSGGFNVFDPRFDPYDPETVDAYEIGLKSELFNNRLTLNGAVFFNEYEDIQIQKYFIQLDIVNGASAEFYGIDVDGEWQATENLRFNAGFVWLNAEFTEFPDADFFFPVPPGYSANPFFPGAGPTYPGGGIDSISGDAAGNKVPFAPELTLNFAVNYSIDLDFGRVDLNLSNAYSSGYFAEPDNLLEQDSFNMLNIGANWTSPNGAWTIGAFGRNMLDEEVIGQMGSLKPRGFSADYSNPPQTYGVSATFRFGAF